MGVLNVTPDSFSDGGRYAEADAAIVRGRALVAAGADILDIGGESTRPGAPAVSEAEELRRVIPVIEGLRDSAAMLSIDTSKAAVAEAACAAGAAMINDVTGLYGDPAMPAVAAASQALVCLMHMQGTPETMQADPSYTDALADVTQWLAGAVDHAVAAGVQRHRILLDPGIGFGKRLGHNLALIRGCGDLGRALGLPVLMGVSRKSFLGRITGKPVNDREWATAAAVTACVLAGARVVRVHDVASMRDVVQVADALADRQLPEGDQPNG
ncbi:MAG: dihydropteroate synthase [Myxococcota bacterium]|jgi:dihydropteroate synthase